MAMQIVERRIAGTEVVYCDPHPHLAHSGEAAHIGLDIGNQQGFGEFQVEVVVLAPVERQHRFHHFQEILASQLHGRDVDGDARRMQAGGMPGPVIGDALFQRPAADIDDQPRFFKNGDEVHRRHETTSGILPTQQRFQADHFAMTQFHLGLVVQDKFPAFERPVQLVLECELFRHARIHLRRIEQVALPR